MDANLVQYTLKYHGNIREADCRVPSEWGITTSLKSMSKANIFFMLFIPWIVDN